MDALGQAIIELERTVLSLGGGLSEGVEKRFAFENCPLFVLFYFRIMAG